MSRHRESVTVTFHLQRIMSLKPVLTTLLTSLTLSFDRKLLNIVVLPRQK